MRRTLLAAAVALLVGAAGCIATPEPVEGASAEGPASEEQGASFFTEDTPQFCEEEASCDYWDEMYHQYVVYDLDTTTIDVLIVPPASASATENMHAATRAVEAWGEGIEELGEAWFTDAFTMTVATVGEDVPSVDAATDPEVIVLATGVEGLIGIGLEPKQIACQLIGEGTVREYPVHRHGLVEVRAADCTTTGFTCFAINVGSVEPRDLYDLIAHEVGHCLGAGHVGDALDFRARYAPVEDIMSYQSNPDQVHCVSTMDVRVLEGVYAHLVPDTDTEPLPEGSFLEYDPREYAQVVCENPDA